MNKPVAFALYHKASPTHIGGVVLWEWEAKSWISQYKKGYAWYIPLYSTAEKVYRNKDD